MTVRVGVDYDGVLADTQGFVVRFVREQLDVEITRADMAWVDGRPGIDPDLGLESGQGYREFASNPEYVAALEPLEGVRSALWDLAADDRFELHLATHRPEAVHDAIEEWLAANELPSLAMPEDVPEPKAATSPPLDVLIDDYHGHADAAARNGLLGVHLTAAWESGDPRHPETVSATSWAEVLDAIVDGAGP